MSELRLNFIPEFRFNISRRWRADYRVLNEHAPDGASLRERCCLIEIEGAIFTRGRHTRGAGYEKDLEKYREAALLGYSVFRFSTSEVLRGDAKKFLERWIREAE